MIRYAFKKIGMSQCFKEDGRSFGVTILKLFPSKVVRHETLEDGRHQVIVEIDLGVRKKICKGFFVKDLAQYPVGSSLDAPKLTVGQKVLITGVSKGKGFQDVITRYGFGGGPASHGSRFHRAPGSVGMRTEPGRTPKGKKMPGRDGFKTTSLKNVEVAHWSQDESILALVGGVPGSSGNVIFI